MAATVRLSRQQLLSVSVTVTGRDRDLLLVIGDGVDEAKLARKLSKEAGQAEIVELRTLPSGVADPLPPVASMGMVAALSSPYHRHHHYPTPGRSLPLPGPGGDELSRHAGYIRFPCTPSPGHYCCPSPVAGQGWQGGYGYGGSGNERGRPVNFSPMIAGKVGWGRRRGGKPTCCAIL
ncbi:unnamed protein product [Urochloa humidicola]